MATGSPSSPEASGNSPKPNRRGSVGSAAVRGANILKSNVREMKDNSPFARFLENRRVKKMQKEYLDELKKPLSDEERALVDRYAEDENYQLRDNDIEIIANKPNVGDALTEINKRRLLKAYPEIDASEIPEDFFSELDGKEHRKSYKRSLLNSDIDAFLNGAPITFASDIFSLKEGGKTNVLRLDWLKAGEYDRDIRYTLRAVIGRYVIKTGSKAEKSNAVYFAKNIFNEIGLGAYVGATSDTLNADALHCISQDFGADFYACGADKPRGYQGYGFTRETSEKYADQVNRDAQDILFGQFKDPSEKAPIKGISNVWHYAKNSQFTFNDTVSCYAELNNSGKSRIDAMAEFTRTLRKEKVEATINGFDGSDQVTLVHAFRLYGVIRKSTPEEQVTIMRLLGLIDDEEKEPAKRTKLVLNELIVNSKALYNNYARNSNLSYYMKQPLADAIADFIGIPADADNRMKFGDTETPA
jgi:hypothetical protein